MHQIKEFCRHGLAGGSGGFFAFWTGLFVVGSIAASRAEAALVVGQEFAANEKVESISVRLSIGEGGELDVPLALDLGLGFPLWLFPLGHRDGLLPVYGAVPPVTDAGPSVAAGKAANFTFQATGPESGRDEFLSCRHLLDGVTVSDISRVGFSSPGESAWLLGGYEILINGKPFATNSAAKADAGAAQGKARERLEQLKTLTSPLREEASQLQALIETGLAFPEDQARLARVREELEPLLKEESRLERQLAGSFPWFSETEFKPSWRTGEGLGQMRITLVTAAHDGAGTNHCVYFRAGGHKFLVAGPSNPLDPARGPLMMDLDLESAPMTAADLRGFGLGMLAASGVEGQDAWHPQRLVVEIDGREVYDSDTVELDRLSLEAIRVVAPACRNVDKALEAHEPNPRETFLWEPGNAMGLDLSTGGAAAVPGDLAANDWTGGSGEVTETPGTGSAPPNFELLVAEEEFPPGWAPPPDWVPPWSPWGPGGGWGPPLGWGDIVGGLLGWLLPLPPGIIPDPFGPPFQVAAPRLEMPALPTGVFNVHWTTTGDVSQIENYFVEIREMYPERDYEYGARLGFAVVPAGATSCSITLTTFPDPADWPYAYLTAIVVARPTLAAEVLGLTPEPGFSPARPAVFTGHLVPQLESFATFASGGGAFGFVLADDPGAGSAVWWEEGIVSHRGIVFDDPAPAKNVGFRFAGDPVPNNWIDFSGHAMLDGRFKFGAHVGFAGGDIIPNHVSVRTDGLLLSSLHAYPAGPPVPIINPTAGLPAVMPRIALNIPVVDSTDGGWVGPQWLQGVARVEDLGVHPDHPAILFGVRLVPEIP